MQTVTAIESSTPAWLAQYKAKNLTVVESQPLKKSIYFSVPLFNSFLASPSTEKSSVAVEGATHYSWKAALADKKLANTVKMILEKEKLPENQFEAFVNTDFSCGEIILIDAKASDRVTVTISAGKEAVKNIFVITTKGKQIHLTINGSHALVNSTFFFDKGTQAYVLQIPKATQTMLNFQNILEEKALSNTSVVWALPEKTKATYTNIINGRECLAKQNDVVFLDNTQEAHVDMVALHIKGGSRSETHTKCILKGNAKQSFDGMIKILPAAQQTDSYLEANSMILSSEAKSVNIPKLEIEADDVKATHAATVEHIEEDKLFYLGTRGLKRTDAERIIISSFLEGNMLEYPEEIKNAVKDIIAAKIMQASAQQ